MFIKFLLAFLTLSFSIEYCHQNCKECDESIYSEYDMKCTSCRDNYYFFYNTHNCVDKKQYPETYISDGTIYPCSNYDGTNCYECNPFLNTSGICLSCQPNYFLDLKTNECIFCNEKLFLILKSTGCRDAPFEYCTLSITCCSYPNNCASILPIGCQREGIKDETCIISKKNNVPIFINWLYDNKETLRYPSLNLDKSSYLLIELSPDSNTEWA